jgi:hypothetical protein
MYVLFGAWMVGPICFWIFAAVPYAAAVKNYNCLELH